MLGLGSGIYVTNHRISLSLIRAHSFRIRSYWCEITINFAVHCLVFNGYPLVPEYGFNYDVDIAFLDTVVFRPTS